MFSVALNTSQSPPSCCKSARSCSHPCTSRRRSSAHEVSRVGLSASRCLVTIGENLATSDGTPCLLPKAALARVGRFATARLSPLDSSSSTNQPSDAPVIRPGDALLDVASRAARRVVLVVVDVGKHVEQGTVGLGSSGCSEHCLLVALLDLFATSQQFT